VIKKFNDFDNINESVKLSKVVKRVEFDGYTIYIGRTAEMNDILTFEISSPDDIWMHVSGVPGSHVVIKVKDKEIPPIDVIEHAAELAKQNSKATGKCKVVWTKRRNVSKSPDQNDGQVNVNYKQSKFIKI